MLTAHCSLLNAHCSLLNSHCSLPPARCPLHCSLLTAHCSLLTAHGSRLTLNPHCSLLTHCPLPAARCPHHCSLLIARCSLLTAHYQCWAERGCCIWSISGGWQSGSKRSASGGWQRSSSGDVDDPPSRVHHRGRRRCPRAPCAVYHAYFALEPNPSVRRCGEGSRPQEPSRARETGAGTHVSARVSIACISSTTGATQDPNTHAQ